MSELSVLISGLSGAVDRSRPMGMTLLDKTDRLRQALASKRTVRGAAMMREHRAKVLAVVTAARGEKMTVEQIAQAAGICYNSTNAYLKLLEREGVLTRRGGPRGAYVFGGV